MPITAFLHSHVLVVVLFLFLFIIKSFLLFTNRQHALETLKRKTKVADMVLGTLILITGAYLMFQYNGIPTWLLVKVVLVLAAIPLAITGMKKSNKPLVALALIIFVYVYGVAEAKNLSMQKAEPAPMAEAPEAHITETAPEIPMENAEENAMPEAKKSAPAIGLEMSQTALANARQIYLQQCEVCHGKNGKKGLNNATDLAWSSAGLAARKEVILNGRGLMPAYKGQISEQEAEQIAAYTLLFRK